MAKINSYSTALPALNDLLLGTDSDAANATKNFFNSFLLLFYISALPIPLRNAPMPSAAKIA